MKRKLTHCNDDFWLLLFYSILAHRLSVSTNGKTWTKMDNWQTRVRFFFKFERSFNLILWNIKFFKLLSVFLKYLFLNMFEHNMFWKPKCFKTIFRAFLLLTVGLLNRVLLCNLTRYKDDVYSPAARYISSVISYKARCFSSNNYIVITVLSFLYLQDPIIQSLDMYMYFVGVYSLWDKLLDNILLSWIQRILIVYTLFSLDKRNLCLSAFKNLFDRKQNSPLKIVHDWNIDFVKHFPLTLQQPFWEIWFYNLFFLKRPFLPYIFNKWQPRRTCQK
jgi:hypothetical protein